MCSKNFKKPSIKRDALALQRRMNWGDFVTSDQLKEFVNVFKEYRLTIVLGSVSDYRGMTFTGENYVFDGVCTTTRCIMKKTLYLIWTDKHYGFCDPASPRSMMTSGQSNSIFCHKCTSIKLRSTGLCNCTNAVKKPVRLVTCPDCHCKPCMKTGCFHKCPVCKTKFKHGYNTENGEGHRCIIYHDKNPSDYKNPLNDGYRLWAYDIEAKTTIGFRKVQEFKKNEHGFVVENGEYVVAEKDVAFQEVNMVIFRDVFSNEEFVRFGPQALSEFIHFMLNENDGKNICVAHNGSGYDSRMVIEEITKYTEKPKLQTTSNGTKYTFMQSCNTIFRDSLLHLPGSLAGLAKSFQLTIKKGTFPHLFNSIENYGYEGPLPAKSFFDLSFTAKSQKDIDDFNIWYAERSQTPWNFMTELTEYCRDDVKILAQIMKKHHDICVEKFGLSPWQYNTAPGFCHTVIKKQLTENLDIPEEMDTRRRVIDDLAWNKHWGVLLPQEYWFARKALMGGRTDVRRIHYELSEEDYNRGVRIKYQDVVSMYPFVQAGKIYEYPVGLPRIKIYDSKYFPCSTHQSPLKGNDFEFCSCTREERMPDRLINVEELEQPTLEYISNYDTFGIICVSMTPPKNLFHPVLLTWNSKSKKRVANLLPIIEQVYTTVEVQRALSVGYTLNKVHRLDLYNKSEGLWADFVRDLYIEKMRNSEETPSFEEQERLVNEYEDRFGIGEKVRESFPAWGFNGALRQVYKIMLNSGWGKHCQRPNLRQKMFIDETDHESMTRLFSNAENDDLSIANVFSMGNQTVYEVDANHKYTTPKDLYLPAGLFVPAYGRLLLYDAMELLGDRVLYHDTDSVIYIYDPELENIPQGNIWGEWDEEKVSLNGNITKFIGLGAKSYALKTKDGCDVIKLKGLSIKHSHRHEINFEKLEEMIFNQSQKSIPQRNFIYKMGEGIHIEERFKKLTFTHENLKGFVHNKIVYPYGYCKGCIGIGTHDCQ